MTILHFDNKEKDAGDDNKDQEKESTTMSNVYSFSFLVLGHCGTVRCKGTTAGYQHSSNVYLFSF